MPLNIVLDATMLDTFQSCEAKFNYRFNHNKVTITKAKPLDRGTLVHNAFEAYFKFLQKDPNWNAAVDAIKMAILSSSFESDLESSEINRVYEVVLESCERWKYRDLRFEILGVEESFAYVLYEDEFIRIVMIGKIDLRVNYENYENLPIDHKSYERNFPLRRRTNQFCNYSYALNSNYLFVNRVGFQTSIKPEDKHLFVPLSYDPVFHEQWRQNVIHWVKDRYVNCVTTGIYPMNDTSCDKYGRICEYNDVCDTSGEEGKIFKLNVNFNTAEQWDVSASLGKKNEQS